MTFKVTTPEITLRDYFAAAAMQGIIAANKNSDYDEEIVSIYAYAMADNMLIARERKE